MQFPRCFRAIGILRIGHTIAILMLGFKSEFSRTSNNRFSTFFLENETLEDSSNLPTTGILLCFGETYLQPPYIISGIIKLGRDTVQSV